MQIDYYITNITPVVKDGGMSRNNSFYTFFSSKKKSTIILNFYNKRFFYIFMKLLKVLLLLFFSSKKNIFIHQGTILYLFPVRILKISIVFRFVFWLLDRLNKKNRLIIEVNDLIYEQSIDLGLKVDAFYQKFQNRLFEIRKAHFIFASSEMEKYVKATWNLPFTDTIINGGKELGDIAIQNFDCLNLAEVKFVYAGTLNKGRQIEELIQLFSNFPQVQLILLGSEGEWIFSEVDVKNIHYLGNFEESIAQQIVSKCDVGIIPYDANRFYYNLCYPTKASFYITAGITFLSTPVDELKNHFEESNSAYFIPIEEWKNFIINIDKKDILEKTNKAKEIMNKFTWNSLINQKLDNFY